MSPELLGLIEAARDYKMTPEEKKEQAISFAFGNANLSDPTITREDIVEAYKRIHEAGRPLPSP